MSSGYDAVMLQNIQLDEINGPRFGIRLADGEFPAIIHACVAMGGSRMLPLVLGRGLAGLGPKEIPAELAAVQVAFVPLAEKHVGRAYELAGSLWTREVRTAVDLEFRRPVRARIGRLRRDWQPLFCVIGDRELTETPGLQTSGGQRIDAAYEPYLAEQLPRWLRCLPRTPAGTAAPSPVLSG
ncbi:His/Gly/Thr/Pro-type tRNA ligase C-terminal domain-containing protein [Streptomyces lasalocidi]